MFVKCVMQTHALAFLAWLFLFWITFRRSYKKNRKKERKQRKTVSLLDGMLHVVPTKQ